MAGGDDVEAETMRAFEQQVEFNVSVALDARIGRATGGVGLDEGRDDVALELLGVVEDVVIDAEHLGDAACVVHVRDRATARVRYPTPELQRGAHDFVALLEQETGGDRRIDPATHGDQNFHRPSLPVASYRPLRS